MFQSFTETGIPKPHLTAVKVTIKTSKKMERKNSTYKMSQRLSPHFFLLELGELSHHKHHDLDLLIVGEVVSKLT
jgi:hypothetical protein